MSNSYSKEPAMLANDLTPPGGRPKGAVPSGPTGVLLQTSDIKVIPNGPKEKSNDR